MQKFITRNNKSISHPNYVGDDLKSWFTVRIYSGVHTFRSPDFWTSVHVYNTAWIHLSFPPISSAVDLRIDSDV